MSDLFLGKKTDNRRYLEKKEAALDRDYKNEGECADSNRPIVDRLRDSQPKGTTGGYLLNDAADRIQQLEAELALKAEINLAFAQKIKDIRAEIARKDEALREIQKDAERYHWLKNQHWTFKTLCVTRPDAIKLGMLTYTEERLDAMIDMYLADKAREALNGKY